MTPPEPRRLEIASDRDRGRGDYAAYHALWHLAQIGVVADLQTFASEAWDLAAARIDDGARRTRVALIDTSVAVRHPNLSAAIDTDLAIDFFSSRLGVPASPDALDSYIKACKKAYPSDLPAAVGAYWNDLLAHLRGDAKTLYTSAVQPANSPNFSAHGTAMAGLIGARPVAPDASAVTPVRIFDPVSGTYHDLPTGQAVAFAYAGVDPFCQIVPISTNFDPEPEQLILALLYADLIEADIIVLARDFPTPASLAPHIPRTNNVAEDATAFSLALGVGLSAQELSAWDSLQHLTIALSKRIPVVCAAGNGAQGSILCPGSLAAPDNGIIAVGARAATGNPAAYSPESDHITVYAPSGDGERLDSRLQRLDTQSARFNPNDHSIAYTAGLGNYGDQQASNGTGVSTHATQDLISTDVPGRAGYNSSPNAQIFGHEGAVLDYRSAYCRYSGTSGAAALTAGLLSLAMSAGRITPGGAQFGPAAKAALCGTKTGDYASAEPAIHWKSFSPDQDTGS